MNTADDVVDSEKLSRIRKVQMNLIEQLLRLCEKHEIEVFAVYGTLLGTVRHGGAGLRR